MPINGSFNYTLFTFFAGLGNIIVIVFFQTLFPSEDIFIIFLTVISGLFVAASIFLSIQHFLLRDMMEFTGVTKYMGS
jgi:hypothetical protein